MILDSETKAFITVAALLAPLDTVQQTGLITFGAEPKKKPKVRPEIEQWLRGRIEYMRAGVEKTPKWFASRLKQFDKDLRLRWEFAKQHWVIERFNELDNLYHACGIWDKPLGEPLIDALRKGDMWRVSPEEQIKQVHEASERQQRSNDAKIEDQLYGAIDGMAQRQVEEFVAASEAMVNGEEIIPHGDDAKFMQTLHDKNMELLKKGVEIKDDPSQCLNPGMKPGTYQRKVR